MDLDIKRIAYTLGSCAPIVLVVGSPVSGMVVQSIEVNDAGTHVEITIMGSMGKPIRIFDLSSNIPLIVEYATEYDEQCKD